MKQFSVIRLALAAVLCVLLAAPVLGQGPRPMEADILTPLQKAYDFIQAGKYDAAEEQLKIVLKKDTFNPFALNNLAAIAFQKGQIKEAIAYLADALKDSDKYLDKVQETCFVGGMCNAVKPVGAVGATSSITPIIKDNKAKLEKKLAESPLPPTPSTPPAMDVKKPEKEKGK
uniref:Tetratricopeptide repeat protein n=1 Tax=Desulfobacca acetoxidans TaxID=60893 RepID=A0A7V4G910_9BACT